MADETSTNMFNETLKVVDAALGSSYYTSTSKKTFGRENRDEDLSYLCDVTVPPPMNMTLDMTLNQTSAAILAQEDPGHKAAQVLFSEFVNIFVSHPSDAQVWDEISAYEKACTQQAESLMNIVRKVPRHHSHFSKTEQMSIRLKEERNTWRLLGSLYYERLNENMENEEYPLIETTKDRTDKKIISQLYEKSSFIREVQNVVDWLEKNAEDDSDQKYFDRVDYFGNTHIAWENTLRVAKNEKDQLKSGSGSSYGLGGRKPLITSLDPDAPLRQKKPLHDLDQEEDQRLVRSMFLCIRAGQLVEAQELCAKSGQHWRAAAIEGWRLFHDPNPDDPRLRNPVSGNQYRDVWKAVAWRAASDERLPKEERAVYGALCGHLPGLLEICTSWEDQLWAYFRVLIDQRVEETLRGNSMHLRSLHPLPKDYPEEKLTKEGIFRLIDSRLNDNNSKTMYNVMQKYLILNDIEGLVNTSHEWLEQEESISPHLLRCLSHLLLVLKRFGSIPCESQDKVTDILHACVKEAMERGDVEQVARYASILPDWLQVRCYANFLLNICDEHHSKHALHLASMVGLDTQAITTTVVAKIRLEPGRDNSSEIISDTNAEDKKKINALDWLLYDRSQRPEALRQANAMIRHFLISRKMGAAKTLFHKIPADSIDATIKLQKDKTGSTDLPTHLENRIREYLCFRTFLDAQESFTDWFDHYHQKKPTAPRKPKVNCDFTEQLAYDHSLQQYESDLEKWKNTLNLITKKATERLYNVLLFPDGGWLGDLTPIPLIDDKTEEDDEDMESEDNFLERRTPLDMSQEDIRMLQYLEPEFSSREPQRENQLTTLRSIYIPQVTSLLQNILHSTENYKECIQLTDLIASEKHGLYKNFGTGEMQRFLFKLQDTSKELLDQNYDALGYKLH